MGHGRSISGPDQEDISPCGGLLLDDLQLVIDEFEQRREARNTQTVWQNTPPDRDNQISSVPPWMPDLNFDAVLLFCTYVERGSYDVKGLFFGHAQNQFACRDGVSYLG
jgi:hypothetical protein